MGEECDWFDQYKCKIAQLAEHLRIFDLSVIISLISVIHYQLLSYKVKHLPVKNTEKNNHFIIQVIKLNVHNLWGEMATCIMTADYQKWVVTFVQGHLG